MGTGCGFDAARGAVSFRIAASVAFFTIVQSSRLRFREGLARGLLIIRLESQMGTVLLPIVSIHCYVNYVLNYGYVTIR